MKILIINALSKTNAVGGAEKSVHLTACELYAKGHDVLLLAFHRSWKFRYMTVDSVPILLCPCANIYWPFDGRVRHPLARIFFNIFDIINPISIAIIAGIVAFKRPCIAWTNMVKGWSVGSWLILKIMRVPVVATLREFDLLYSGESIKLHPESPKAIPGISALKCFFTRFPDAVVGISKYILNLHKNAGYFRNSRDSWVIANPIDVSINYVKRPLVVGNDMLRIGWIGRFSAEKGIHVFLGAAHKLKFHKKFNFYIAGSGDLDLIASVQKAQANGEVRYVGFSKNFGFFIQIDVLVVTSLWPEPFGRVVIEGFQYGCYVLSTDRGGLPEINKNKSCGQLFDGSVDDLCAKLEKISFEKILSAREAARVEALTYISALIADEYIKVFESHIIDNSLNVNENIV